MSDAWIWIRLCQDPETGRNYRVVYYDGKPVASHWRLKAALAHAEALRKLTGATIWSAPVLPFAKRGAA